MPVSDIGALPESRREWVLRLLRQRIASGDLPPGSRLVERDLSTEFGTSRGPIREAIMVLEQEGLLVGHPYRGVRVAAVSGQEIANVLVPIRLLIERSAFRAVAASTDQALLDRLEGLVRQMSRASVAGDAEWLAELDVRFHDEVIVAGGGVQSSRLWQAIQPRVQRYFSRDALRHPPRDDVMVQHRRLLDALRSGDPEVVERAIEDHIRTYLDDGDEVPPAVGEA